MATSIGQYILCSYLENLPSTPLTENPGRLQSTGSQTVGHEQGDTTCINMRLFSPVAALGLSVKVVQLLGLCGPWGCQVCRDLDYLRYRSYGPIRSFFKTLVAGLFGQSFSIALPIQALRGLPYLGSFSAVPCVRYIKGPPGWSLYSVGRCTRYLKWHPAWGPNL